VSSAAMTSTSPSTRTTRHLLDRHGVAARRLVSFFEGNEAARTEELMQTLREGGRVVLVTDAGMPSVSDPGYRLVAAAVAEDIEVTAVPGPSAVLAALAVSGLPVDRFCFEGFLPRKAGERRSRLDELADEPRTMVFFEAPHRTVATLEAMAHAFGDDRSAAVCRELTKLHEQVRRGPVRDLADWASGGVRGEVTIVVAGRMPEEPGGLDDEQVATLVRRAEQRGLSRRDAVAAVARETGLPRRSVYDIAHRR